MVSRDRPASCASAVMGKRCRCGLLVMRRNARWISAGVMAFPDRLLAQFAHFRFAAFRGEALTLQAMQSGFLCCEVAVMTGKRSPAFAGSRERVSGTAKLIHEESPWAFPRG